jgi:hypothetical protein
MVGYFNPRSVRIQALVSTVVYYYSVKLCTNDLKGTSLMKNSFINLGGPLRIRATKDPGPEDVLPSDDTVWENSVYPVFLSKQISYSDV